MKVSYKTVLPEEEGSLVEYQALDYEPCCNRMHLAYQNDAVVFADDEWPQKNPALHVRHASLDWEGGLDHDDFEIAFCPFCGVRVECTEVRRVRKRSVETTHTVTRFETREEPVGPDGPPAGAR